MRPIPRGTSWVALITAAACFVVAAVALLPLGVTMKDIRRPYDLGHIGSIRVSVLVGDIAIPNEMRPVPGQTGTFSLSPDVRHWDAYVVSAPVPRRVPGPDGAQLEIPWTQLPSSTVVGIGQVDPEYANVVATWLGLQGSSADWSFARMRVLDVPDNTYRQVTGVNRLYAVNLFNFVKEFGTDYKKTLATAVSEATKEFVEAAAGQDKEARLAFPAIAGAAFVRERELVLTYHQCFNAIFRGVARADDTPSSLTVVVWTALEGTPAFKVALEGVEDAAFRHVTEWRARLRLIGTILTSLAIVVGVIFGYSRQRRSAARPLTVVFSGIGLAVTAGSYTLLTEVVQLLPLIHPPLDIAALSFLGVYLGAALQRADTIQLAKDKVT